jgi:hypothetical protein
MIVLGPLIGFMFFFGIAGLLAGKLIAALVTRHSQQPHRVGRWAAWTWLLVLAVAGVALAMEAFTEPDGGGLSGSVVLMFLWFGFVNAATGFASIRSVIARSEPVF